MKHEIWIQLIPEKPCWASYSRVGRGIETLEKTVVGKIRVKQIRGGRGLPVYESEIF